MRLCLLLAAIISTAACTSDSAADVRQEVTICDGPSGSSTDLTTEPAGFRDTDEPRIFWTDDAGCAINMEFVFHRFGDEHCNWEETESISLGIPIGIPYTGTKANPPGQDWEPLYFHNANGALDWLDPGQLLTELPADAIDSGLRAADNRELWSSPDNTEVYIRRADTVQVFLPTSDDDVSCA